MHKRFSGLLIGLLSLVPALVKVHAASGSPTIISAFPNATAAADNNQDAPGAPVGKVFKYFMQIWLENEVRSVSGFRFPFPTALSHQQHPGLFDRIRPLHLPIRRGARNPPDQLQRHHAPL